MAGEDHRLNPRQKTEIPTAPVRARWHRFRLAETDASDHASAACYRRTKNIRVVAVVIAELELSNVQRQVLGAHLVERADNAAFEDAPKPSIVLVCTAPTTYSCAECRTAACCGYILCRVS